jgi:hypothetical protein
MGKILTQLVNEVEAERKHRLSVNVPGKEDLLKETLWK